MAKKIAAWVIEHRFVVLGIILIMTIFFALQARKIVIKTELGDLYPSNHPFIKVHNKYKDQLGSPFKVFVMLKVKRGDIYNRRTLQKIFRITAELDAIPGVNHNQVFSIASRKLKKIRITEDAIITENLMEKVPGSEAEMEELKKAIRTTPGVFGVWVSRDEKAVLFTAGFIERLMKYDVILEKVNSLISKERDSNHEICAAGEPILRGWIYKYQTEMWWIFGATFLSLFLLLYLYFRNLPGVLVPVLSTIVTAIWGLGFVGLMGYTLDPLILVVPLLIMARALSHAVQITERYFECYQEVKQIKEACIRSMSSILPPGSLSIITDALGLLLIAVAPIPLLQKLAYMCAFWAISIIFSGLIFVPIMLSFFSPPGNIPDIVDTEKGAVQKILRFISYLGYGRSAFVVLIIIVVLGVFTGYMSSKVEIGDIHPGTPLLWEDSDYNTAIAEINRNFPGTEELYVIVEGKGQRAVADPDFLKILNRFQRYMENRPLVARTLSVADFIPPIQRAIYNGYPKWETLPPDAMQVGQIFYRLEAHSAPGDYDLYFTRDGSAANVIVWYKNHMASTLREAVASVREFIQKNRKALEKAKCTFRLASGNIGLLAAINETVRSTQLLNLILVMSVIFLLCSLTYRSIVAALILMIPLNLSNMITMSIMHWLGIGLNINTLPVVSVGVGVGIDYGIYLLSRLCEEYQAEGKYSLSVAMTSIRTTGKAIFFTATTMVAGVIFWYFFSSLKFQAEMGLLLAIIMFLNMIMALVVIPAVVYIFKPKFLGKTKLIFKEGGLR